MKETQPGPKRRRLQLQRDLDADIANETVTAQILERKLLEHVETVDANMVRCFTAQLHFITGCMQIVSSEPTTVGQLTGGCWPCAYGCVLNVMNSKVVLLALGTV
jgi:hypothetical protein